MTTQAEVENVMRIVDKVVLARWSGHRDADDIRAEGYYLAWQGYQRAKALAAYKPTTRVFCEARQAAAHWFRRQEPPHAPLSEVLEASVPDAGPPVEARVLSQLEWEAALAFLPVRERAVIRRLFGEGMGREECGRALGVSPQRVDQLKKQALNRLRHRLNLLPPPDPASSRVHPFCRFGHAFTAENTYRSPNGERHCILCRQSARREYRRRLKERES